MRFSKVAGLGILRSTARQALLLFVLAFLVRIAIAVDQHSWAHNVRAEMEREAISMARTGVLGNPFSLPTGPSATVPPVYPLIMSAIFRTFGSGPAGESMKVLLTCLVSSMTCALVPWLGRRLKFASPVGLAAGLVGALIPLNPYIEVQGDFENHLSAMLLLMLLAWTDIAARRVPTAKGAVALGAFYGICLLTNPSLGPLCFLSFVFIGYQHRDLLGARPQLGLLAAIAALLVIAPWGIRNDRQLGSPIVTRSNFGLEFFLANNDEASPLMVDNRAIYECCHPLLNEDQAREIQRIGEVEYNATLKRRAFAWVREHPSRFVRLTALRIWYFWVPVASEELRTFAFRLITVLSFSGIVLIWRSHRKATLLVSVPLIVYPLPYYVMQIHLRYRYPVNFILLLLSCATLYSLWQRISGHRRVAGYEYV